MLVLSRGAKDKVVFPTLGITVEVLRVAGSKVRLGIEAPPEIPILRDEIVDRKGPRLAEASKSAPAGGLTHAVRNRLQKATLGLRILQRKLDSGRTEDAEPTIFRILNELKFLEEELTLHSNALAEFGNASNGYRALVVEDDPNERELLAGYLRLSGFEVETAMDGLQAMLCLSKQQRPDVVLLDMRMPRFDGQKTVSAIRQNPDYQSLRILAVTGTDQAEVEVAIGPHGVNQWFRKPIDPQRLVDALHNEAFGPVALA